MNSEFLPSRRQVRIVKGALAITLTMEEVIELIPQLNNHLQRVGDCHVLKNRKGATHRVWSGDCWIYLQSNRDSDVMAFTFNRGEDRTYAQKAFFDDDGKPWWRPL